MGRELCPLMKRIGFEVVLLDDRPDFASSQMHPDADRIILCDYADIYSCISIEKNDFVVIMTHGHIGDRDVLLQVCRSEAGYIGCIGSRKKVEGTAAFLRENGISDEKISSIHSPIGLPIGGSSPQEIAVSVAAEIIQCRYKENI